MDWKAKLGSLWSVWGPGAAGDAGTGSAADEVGVDMMDCGSADDSSCPLEETCRH